MNIQKPNTNIFQTTQSPNIKYANTNKMNIRKSNTNIFQTQQNPETKYTQTPTQMKIQKPNTKLFQTKQHPEITDTRTHTNKHTTTQYKHMSNKNKSGNTIHKNPQA